MHFCKSIGILCLGDVGFRKDAERKREMPEKTRYPAHQLSHADYLGWIRRVVKWLGTQVGKPDYPAVLADALCDCVDEYEAAAIAWANLRSVSGGKHKVYIEAFKALRKHVVMVRKLLPLVAEDPPILGEFGLAGKIERDMDDLRTRVNGAVKHWQEVCAPDPPVELLPVQADLDKLVDLMNDFEATRLVYMQNYMAAQQAQNRVLTTRTACHKAERKIFRWYRAHHPRTNGEWWTATEWGASRGRPGRPPGNARG